VGKTGQKELTTNGIGLPWTQTPHTRIKSRIKLKTQFYHLEPLKG
jgi:hypothetical protein